VSDPTKIPEEEIMNRRQFFVPTAAGALPSVYAAQTDFGLTTPAIAQDGQEPLGGQPPAGSTCSIKDFDYQIKYQRVRGRAVEYPCDCDLFLPPRGSGFAGSSGKCVYDAAPDTSPPPAGEAVVASGVWAKCLRQITPGCPGSQDPKDAIEDTAVIHPRHATRFVGRIGFMAVHSYSASSNCAATK
jgi:hypothetical protein